jgi:Fe-S-cluster containining protein
MITIEEINADLNDVKPLFFELQNLYGCLPATQCRCDQPGVCCAFLPEMTWVEALRWIGVINDLQEPAMREIIRKFLEFYLTTPIRHTGCPFLIDGHCGIYPYRSFACRAYGLWSQTAGDNRTRENRFSRQALLNVWEQFGVAVPEKMVTFEIDYCDRVQCAPEKPISDGQLMDILQQVYRLDQALPDLRTRFEAEYHSDFSFLIASLVLGYRRAVLGKFAVIKEIVRQGTEARLEQMLGKATPDVLISS